MATKETPAHEISQPVIERSIDETTTAGLASLVIAHAASLKETSDFDTERIAHLEESPS